MKLLLALMAMSFFAQVGEFVDRVAQTKLVRDGRSVARVELSNRYVALMCLDQLKLSQDDLALLAEVKHLRGLSFRNTNFQDADVKFLQNVPELRYLDLSFTDVTDNAVDELAKLQQLRTICLVNVKITPKGVERIRAGIKKQKRSRLLVGYSQRNSTEDSDESSVLCCRSFGTAFDVEDSVAKTEVEMKPYDELIEHTDVKFRMAPIPGGSFQMGSPTSELDRKDDEGPLHKVTIDPFWICLLYTSPSPRDS